MYLFLYSQEKYNLYLFSYLHSTGQIYFDDINQEKDYRPWKSYAQSKLANVLFTKELANRLQGAISYFITERMSVISDFKMFYFSGNIFQVLE